MSYFGVSLRNGVGLGLGTVPSLTNTPLSYRLAPSLDLSFAGSDALSPAITFSRTTNATVTGSNGLIQNAPMNLLTFSEQFDNAAWTKTRASISANTTVAPDGTTTADKVVEDTSASNTHQTSRSTSVSAGTPYTFSVYIKAAGRNFVGVRYENGGSTQFYQANVNLTNGTATTSSTGSPTGTSFSVTSVGNDWWRISITVTASDNSFVSALYLQSAQGTNAYTGNGTDGAFLWGAQLELGSTATTYNPTTVKNLLGFTENFDNAAWTKSNAFVQTNLLTYSQDFDNAAWSKGAGSVVANAASAPDGSVTADTFTEDATTAGHSVYRNAGSLTGAYTQSMYVKPNGRTWVYLEPAGTSASRTWFSLSGDGVLGTVGTGVTASVSNVGNGWYRIVATFTYAAQNCFVTCGLATGNGVTSYAGDGTSGVFIWGAQLVQGTSAGDYKATYAAAAAVGYTDIYGQPFAQKLVETTATGTHQAFQNYIAASTGVPMAFSVYAKAAERSILNLLHFGAFDLSFNLTTGVATGTGASMVSIGDGWWRCIAISNSPDTVNRSFVLRLNNGTISYTGDGTSGIYIFGAQLSDSASVDPYVYQPVAAPTSTAYYGPRFDYDPVTLAPKGLLIEEQRTNLLTYSEQFDNAAWTKSATTVTSNSVVSPDGTVDADTLTSDGTATQHSVSASPTLAVTTAYAFSVYAKAGTTNFLQITTNLVAGSINHYANFNLQTGVVSAVGSSATATIQAVGNGWYRCTAVMTSVLTSSSATFILIPIDSGTAARNPSFSAVTSVYIWGAQLEAGAFATSYIPTVASQVTRAADSASMIGNNFARWYNVTQGTLYSEFSGQTGWAVQLGEGSNFANRIALGAIPTNFAVTDGAGVNQALLLSYTGTATTFVKIAGAYRANDFAASFSGFAPGEDTSGTVPNPSSMTIGFRNVSSPNAFLNSTIKRIAYFPRRLANAEIQSITA